MVLNPHNFKYSGSFIASKFGFEVEFI